jgi:predicted unusual protein kinase regulating ubiquinone biosynthesis (AarF/ABC1/UbiB family)
MERIDGKKINITEEIEEAGLSRPELAKQVTHIILQMVFEDGLF